MKKTFFFLATLAIALAFASCSSDDGINDDPSNEVAAAKAAIKSKLAGMTLFASEPISDLSWEKTTYHWDNPIELFKVFPEKQTPKGTFGSFLYESNGEPFNMVMLYSNGSYRHKCGIYWYDENGDMHNQELWNEYDETSADWHNPNGVVTNEVSRLSDNAGAYTIQLPLGTKFGFYQKSYTSSTSQTLVTEKYDGIVRDYIFYSEARKNWTNPYLVKAGDKLTCQAMTINVDDWTIVGFEDIALTRSSCDRDFNDCVFAINPRQRIIPDPAPEVTDGSVETNLSVSEENGTDKVKLSVHVRAVTDVEIILPIKDEALADDFAIVAKHDVEYEYSEKMTINGYEVTLNYSTTEEGYLKITTSGITKDVLDYCNNTYADGLTFECNLFFGKFDLESEPTIKFTNNPKFYITSCVNNSPEAKDIEVVWDDPTATNYKDLNFVTTGGELVYDHEVYTQLTYEELKKQGYIKSEPITEE